MPTTTTTTTATTSTTTTTACIGPYAPSQLRALVPNPSTMSACEEIVKGVIDHRKKVYDFVSWMFTSTGDFSAAFKCLKCKIDCNEVGEGSMTAPITPDDLKPLLPSEADDLCDLIVKAGQFDAAMTKLVEYIFNEGGTDFSIAFKEDICAIDCSVLTSTTTTSGTTSSTTTSGGGGSTTTSTTTVALGPAVSDLKVSKGYYGGNIIALVFSPVAGANSYKFYRNTVNNFGTATLIDSARVPTRFDGISASPLFYNNVGELAYYHTPPSQSTVYYFWVVGVKNSPASDTGASNVDHGWGYGAAPFTTSTATLTINDQTTTVPGGITKARVILIGGGAAGAGGGPAFGGGGGGGGAIVVGEFTVTPGDVLKVHIESGSLPGTAAAETSGGNAPVVVFQINGVTQMRATAATGGLYNNASDGAGGAGGSGNANVGASTSNPEVIDGRGGLASGTAADGGDGYAGGYHFGSLRTKAGSLDGQSGSGAGNGGSGGRPFPTGSSGGSSTTIGKVYISYGA